MAYELEIKRIYDMPAPTDGRRILVDRLWPRGMKKACAALSEWAKEVTPSPELRKLYHSGEMSFDLFAKAYREELEESADAAAFARRCRSWLQEAPVTLVYANKNTVENHVLVLRQWLLKAMTSCKND
ncbi:DUF488 domain-containing protein [Selenomonas sp.]|uniref:DUF488 domain-containing protein n=1 Tax=Selenomonas sp. TaxID=2053611 RepID=UPI003FA2BB25